MSALRTLMAGRTTFVIAHRMSTVAGADQVLVLDHGRIVERGRHEDLIHLAGGLYRSFLELQLGREVRPAAPASLSDLGSTGTRERLTGSGGGT